jgi:hypothetical protein
MIDTWYQSVWVSDLNLVLNTQLDARGWKIFGYRDV